MSRDGQRAGKDSVLLGLPDRIKKVRKDVGMTQAQLSTLIEMTPAAYSRVERGVVQPSLETFARICTVLDVSADSLLKLDAYDKKLNLKTKEEKSKESTPERYRKILNLLTGLMDDPVALRAIEAVVLFAWHRREGSS